MVETNTYKLIKKMENTSTPTLRKYYELINRYEETIYDAPNLKDNFQSIIKRELEKRDKQRD